MKSTVMRLSEVVEAGTWSARDLIGGAAGVPSCRLCGLTPSAATIGNRGESSARPTPSSALLEPDTGSGTYVCRNRDACERRQELTT